MNRQDVMRSYVPLFYHTSETFSALLEVEGWELDILRQRIEDLKAQYFIDTATWGLDLWEKEYGLAVKPPQSYEDRRSIVKGKIRGIGKVDSNLIKSIAEAYSNGEVNIAFDGGIKVKFIGTRGIPPAIEDLKNQIIEVVPAHLKVEYQFSYLTWEEFDQLSALKQESMKWQELEVYKP